MIRSYGKKGKIIIPKNENIVTVAITILEMRGIITTQINTGECIEYLNKIHSEKGKRKKYSKNNVKK